MWLQDQGGGRGVLNTGNETTGAVKYQGSVDTPVKYVTCAEATLPVEVQRP